MKATIRIIDAGQSRKPSLIRFFLICIGFLTLTFAPGLFADSAAMQWAGFFIVFVFGVMLLVAQSAHSLTIEEAHKKLDELEAHENS